MTDFRGSVAVKHDLTVDKDLILSSLVTGALLRSTTTTGVVVEDTKTYGKRVGQFIISGPLSIMTNATSSLIASDTMTITEVYVVVRTAPQTDGIRIKVKKNGTNIFTGGTDYLEIPAASTSASRTTDLTTTVANNDAFDVELTQVGAAGTEGEDLTVVMRCTL